MKKYRIIAYQRGTLTYQRSGHEYACLSKQDSTICDEADVDEVVAEYYKEYPQAQIIVDEMVIADTSQSPPNKTMRAELKNPKSGKVLKMKIVVEDEGIHIFHEDYPDDIQVYVNIDDDGDLGLDYSVWDEDANRTHLSPEIMMEDIDAIINHLDINSIPF